MNVRSLLIALAAAGAFAVWFTHRGLDEARVDDFYATQVDAFVHANQTFLCAQYAPDYKGSERQVSRAGVQQVYTDKDQACRSMDFLFDFKKKFDAKQTDGGILATEFHVQHDAPAIARDGKSADVHLHVQLNFGGAFIADSEGTDHLVLRGGKLLSAGSQMTSHVSGPLADGVDPASLMTPSGH